MKHLFGEIRQIAFVSQDIDRSMREFAEFWNIGPWHVMRNVEGKMTYKGEPSEIEMSIAISNCGDMQFEIIQQHNEAPSPYRDSLQAMAQGAHVQHLAVWVEDFDKTKAEAIEKGWVPVLESQPGTGESCYVVHPSAPHLCVEISDRSPGKERMRAAVREAAASWDGTNPIREGLRIK